MNRKRNLFWGISIICIALAILLNQFTHFIQGSFWDISGRIVLLMMTVYCIVSPSWFTLFVPLATVYSFLQMLLNIPQLNIWLLLLIAVLLASGMSLLFPRKKPRYYSVNPDSDGDDSMHFENSYRNGMKKHTTYVDNQDQENAVVSLSFGEASKYIRSASLQTCDIKINFGKLSVYFDQVTPSSEGLQINTACNFGELQLFIPKGWRVEQKGSSFIANVEESGNQDIPDETAPTVNITNEATFGHIRVIYL